MTAEVTVVGVSRLDDHVLLAGAGLAMAIDHFPIMESPRQHAVARAPARLPAAGPAGF